MRLAGFAADQASYIKHRLGLASDDELAQVNVIKLAEETGEAANAFLALRGLQRDTKLNGSADERLIAGNGGSRHTSRLIRRARDGGRSRVRACRM